MQRNKTFGSAVRDALSSKKSDDPIEDHRRVVAPDSILDAEFGEAIADVTEE